MKAIGKITVLIIGFVTAAITAIMLSCAPDSPPQSGIVVIHVTEAGSQEGKDFYYHVNTWAMADPSNSMDIDGSEEVFGGKVLITIEDPDNPGTNLVIPGNDCVVVSGWLDIDGSGSGMNCVDMEIEDRFGYPGSANIDGDMVLHYRYREDFHVPDMCVNEITLLTGAGSAWLPYGDGENDLGSVPATTSTDFTMYIENSGNTLLFLEGSPSVQVGGTDAAVFSISTQPTDTTLLPGEVEAFILTVIPPSIGSYQGEVLIPFNHIDNRYRAIFNVTAE